MPCDTPAGSVFEDMRATCRAQLQSSCQEPSSQNQDMVPWNMIIKLNAGNVFQCESDLNGGAAQVAFAGQNGLSECLFHRCGRCCARDRDVFLPCTAEIVGG